MSEPAPHPMATIAAAETDLRLLVSIVLTQAFGGDWIGSSGLTPERIKTVEIAQAAEHRRNPAASPPALIRFTQIWDLATIINKHWELSKPVFRDKPTFTVFIAKLAEFRNPPAHSRDLLPYEEDLARGIAGEIRHRVTIYRSTMAPDRSYYPKIESVRDSLGGEWLPSNGIFGVGLGAPATLSVDQEIEFLCRAWDPEGRDIHWTLNWQVVGKPSLATATGTEVRLKTTITEVQVGESLTLRVEIRGSSKYHRTPHGLDDSAEFHYRVPPPGFE